MLEKIIVDYLEKEGIEWEGEERKKRGRKNEKLIPELKTQTKVRKICPLGPEDIQKKDKNMIQETISKIEARVKGAKALNDEKKKELLNLLSTLKTEVSEFSKTHPEHTQSITNFAEVSIHEAIRQEKNPQLLKLSLQGLSTSAEGFESSHPKLVGIVNSLCLTLSNIGI